MKQKWLCVDRKCIYGKITKVTVKRAPFPRANFGIEIEKLEVYCLKYHCFIRRWVIACNNFQNKRLF